MEARLTLAHPALIHRAAEVLFEGISDDDDPREPDVRIYRHLLALLDAQPEPEGGES